MLSIKSKAKEPCSLENFCFLCVMAHCWTLLMSLRMAQSHCWCQAQGLTLTASTAGLRSNESLKCESASGQLTPSAQLHPTAIQSASRFQVVGKRYKGAIARHHAGLQRWQYIVPCVMNAHHSASHKVRLLLDLARRDRLAIILHIIG